MSLKNALSHFKWAYLTPNYKVESVVGSVRRTYWAADPEKKFKFAYMHLRSTGKTLSNLNDTIASSIRIDAYLQLMGDEGVNYRFVDFGDDIYVALLVDSDDWQVQAKLSELSLDIFKHLFRGPDIRK